ncbi:HD domain-containing protein [Novosphingobium sp.]|uniref:HD domain-containing protein n=1 Tax=Novosphingobium sp. TaxID=1874826 RepID=UPI003342A257
MTDTITTPITDPRFAAIADLITRFGDVHYGETVNQLGHCLQCAQLAVEAGEDDAMVTTALLHDIGQFIDDAGNAAELRGIDARHEATGADYLARWFGPEVTEPVRLHVAAKRYLCAVQPGYADALSAASQLSLALQGGTMAPDEIAAFQANPWFAPAVRLRQYDDMAKRADWPVPDLASHHARVIRVMR